MIKTFTDNWGETQSIIKKDIFGHENGTYTINDGPFVEASFNDIDELAKELQLTEIEKKLLLAKDGWVNEQGELL